MARIIVIDDERDLGFYAEYARTSADGLKILQDAHKNDDRVTELWLDHDLGENEDGFDTIMPVVSWLEEMAYCDTPLNVGVIYIHTANWYAAPVMMDALKKWYNVERAVIVEK